MYDRLDQYDIEFDCTELSERLKSAVTAQVGTLSEICPSDAAVKLKISKPLNRYFAEIKVSSALLTLKTAASALNPLDAVKQAVSFVQKNIGEWKRIRFLDGYPPVNALLVDDDPASAKLLEHCLKKNGCQATMMELPRKAADTLSPKETDLLVLDWSMPGMNGGQFLEFADITISTKFDPDWMPKGRIPVIVYSWHDEAETDFPTTKHFVKIGHIRKSLKYDRLYDRLEGLVTDVRRSKQFTSSTAV